MLCLPHTPLSLSPVAFLGGWPPRWLKATLLLLPSSGAAFPAIHMHVHPQGRKGQTKLVGSLWGPEESPEEEDRSFPLHIRHAPHSKHTGEDSTGVCAICRDHDTRLISDRRSKSLTVKVLPDLKTFSSSRNCLYCSQVIARWFSVCLPSKT